ncbi:MAG: hypothetical protein WC525_09135 [Candidatus Thermoplasmatota archaeon]
MGSRQIEQRLDTIQRFANGTHPILTVALWGTAQDVTTDITPLPREILFPAPESEQLDPSKQEGADKTNEQIDHHLGTGDPIMIFDGSAITAPQGEKKVTLCIDSKTDPLLIGIIHRAQTLFTQHPEWTDGKKAFAVGLLCFGNWNLRRYPFEDFHTTTMRLGEYISRTNVSQSGCTPLSIATSVVGERVGLSLPWHTGKVARFSAFCRGSDEHAWSVLTDTAANEKRLIDWTNYPHEITRDIFAQAKTRTIDQLWEVFCKEYGSFPKVEQEPQPPSLDNYFDLVSGYAPGYGMRHRAVYYTNSDQYLCSARLSPSWIREHR